ncbi:hypothetical protein OE88DRAFT_28684 [Heliocybe sulcata]|uniref:Uncharacterized protein n=1 Tax=Heliocybe sulcata TaxID=5364 RepID=A0A5C3NF57_9AGAM|nr:hypothetical protein OE88DRAFT_28684 [Heliocybe sulcata]
MPTEFERRQKNAKFANAARAGKKPTNPSRQELDCRICGNRWSDIRAAAYDVPLIGFRQGESTEKDGDGDHWSVCHAHLVYQHHYGISLSSL